MSHDSESRDITERVLAHPALAGAAPYLTGQEVSAVGGVVRDAILGRAPGPDVDLVVEGDPAPIARELADGLGGELHEHAEFRTVEVRRAGGVVIDLVGARREWYPVPGGLPEVGPGTLADDLARRDLSINAIALRLGGEARGRIEDPHGGRADLAAGRVRVLHPGSFHEDPSRLVRAARYGGQLGFAFESLTEGRARLAAPALDPTSARVMGELARLLEEPRAAEGLAVLSDLGVTWLRGDASAFAESLRAVDASASRLGVHLDPAWPVRLAVVVSMDVDDLALPGPAARLAGAAREGAERAHQLGRTPRLSEVDVAVRRLGAPGAIGALAAGCDPVAEWWDRTRGPVLAIDGSDLLAAGVEVGPGVGRGLARARAAVLDGEAAGREAELRVALGAAHETGHE